MSETSAVARPSVTVAQILGSFWSDKQDPKVTQEATTFAQRQEALATHSDSDAAAITAGRARICHRH